MFKLLQILSSSVLHRSSDLGRRSDVMLLLFVKSYHKKVLCSRRHPSSFINYMSIMMKTASLASSFHHHGNGKNAFMLEQCDGGTYSYHRHTIYNWSILLFYFFTHRSFHSNNISHQCSLACAYISFNL